METIYPQYYYRYGVHEQTLVKRHDAHRFEAILLLPTAQGGVSCQRQARRSEIATNLDLWLLGCPFVPGLEQLYEAISELLEESKAQQGILQTDPERRAS